jgi:riboflavin synthase
MFTGLIESVGRVTGVTAQDGSLELRVHTTVARELTAGESLAVNGVCLTVAGVDSDELRADIGPETARITTLGTLRRDHTVNLERAMRADGRLGGHLVQGHVDGTGAVVDVRQEGGSHWMTVTFQPGLAPCFVQKGAVAVDGISLTVARLGEDRFDVMIVPFTWEHTNLPSRLVGDRVNIECDMIGKYVARAMELFGPARNV